MATHLLCTKYGYYTPLTQQNENSLERNEFHCHKTEGELTELKKELVKRETLAKCIDRLDLAQYLIMGKGDIKNRIDREEKVKEDVFEAIIGAITLDSNWDFDAMYTSINHLLQPDSILAKHPIQNDK